MSKDVIMKALGVFVIALVLANFLLFIFGLINYKFFWFNMIFFAIIAYFGFPYLAQSIKKK